MWIPCRRNVLLTPSAQAMDYEAAGRLENGQVLIPQQYAPKS